MQKDLMNKVVEFLSDQGFPRYAIENAVRLLEYENQPFDSSTVEFVHCPKCGQPDPHIVKGGFSNSNKQMYRCLDCGRRFVYDYGNLTWHSKMDDTSWFEVFKDAVEDRSVYYTSERLGCAQNTISYMRRKIVRFLSDCINIKPILPES